MIFHADAVVINENQNQTLIKIDDMGMDNVPLEELLNIEWFHNNISQILNMSVDNLTNYINSHSHHSRENQRDALSLLSTITIFYAFIFIAGVLGNLITCIVISRNKFMHTATNFYLFNLAISDLILLISGMPPDLYNMWYPVSYPFTDLMCIIEGILSETAANATVLTITAFTVERYIAICHPFRQHTMSKLSRAIKFILAIWMTAFVLALPQAMQFSVIQQNDGKLCSVKNDPIGHVFAVSGFIFFVGPMTAICVLYVLIGVKLKRSRLLQTVQRRCYDLNRGISGQSRVIRMLVAVAVAFFLCWAPFHAQRLMAIYGSTTQNTSPIFENIYLILTYTSGVLYFLSTCINPLLYNIMSHKFRDAFKITLVRHFGLASKYQLANQHNYSALNRQTGSIRLNTTVNNNDNYQLKTHSFRITEFQNRDKNRLSLSLQDSIRTHSSCRAHRLRCISVSSQSTLMTSLSKNDVFAPNNYSTSAIITTTPALNQNGRHSHHYGDFKRQKSLEDSSCCAIMETEVVQLKSNHYNHNHHHNNHHHHHHHQQQQKQQQQQDNNKDRLDPIEFQRIHEVSPPTQNLFAPTDKSKTTFESRKCQRIDIDNDTDDNDDNDDIKIADKCTDTIVSTRTNDNGSRTQPQTLPLINSFNEIGKYNNQKNPIPLPIISTANNQKITTTTTSVDNIPSVVAVVLKSTAKRKPKTLESLSEKFRWRTRRKVPIFCSDYKNSNIVESPTAEPSPTTQLPPPSLITNDVLRELQKTSGQL